MQDPTSFQVVKAQFPEQEQLKCPRCDSKNTKFCYYNNYNLSQPRHFCKNCRRYWTKGGALRNIPIGGGTRKTTKRSKRTSSAPPSAVCDPDPTQIHSDPVDQGLLSIGAGGSFSSLLASSEPFGTLLESLNPSGSGLKMGDFGSDPGSNSGSGTDPCLQVQSNEGFLGMGNGDSGCWNGTHAWSDLAIYTPAPSFQ
ncbi:hypothetical protein Fmac_012428 [Flemingia macrophylla]|uniref:Dof zinc finger protein n=1 Tax=Flemingia macrophylla TaxID=520843 RepID=A0ABD1MR32_9FABA